jgi:hypothetical protein
MKRNLILGLLLVFTSFVGNAQVRHGQSSTADEGQKVGEVSED